MADSTAKEEKIDGGEGLKLFVRSWRPAEKPRAVIAIVPGFNSHSGYYGWTAEQLMTIGLASYAVDLRGRGQSDGERYYVKQFADYASDVGSLMKLIKVREPGLPVFLLGHSAGGVVACLYALTHQAELAGLLCESFAFQVPAPDFAIAALKGLAHLAPHAHVLALKNADFSRDSKIVKMMNEDPLIAHETQSTQTVAEMARTDDRLKTEFPKITLPLLILHGTHDRATSPSGSKAFFDAAGSKDKALKLYDGAYHDLLNDTDRRIVMGDIRSWIGDRIPA